MTMTNIKLICFNNSNTYKRRINAYMLHSPHIFMNTDNTNQ